MDIASASNPAQYHGKKFLESTIGSHPVGTAAVIGVLVVLVIIVVAVSVRKNNDLKACLAGKSGFAGARSNNLASGSNNPLWWWGSADAGLYGAVGRPSTDYHVATWNPNWRSDTRKPIRQGGKREGLAAGAVPPIPPTVPVNGGGVECAPGWKLGPDGMCHFPSHDAAPVGPQGAANCARNVHEWDPAATAEAQALAQVQALPPDNYGERLLQNAVNLAYDANPGDGLSDAQLEGLMYNGGIA